MAINLTATVEVRRRSWLGTLVRVPLMFRRHYRAMRRYGNGRIVSTYGAWILSSLVLKVR